MEKMVDSNAEALFTAVNEKFDRTEKVNYLVGDDEYVEITIQPEISLLDLRSIVNVVLSATYGEDMKENTLYRDCEIARCIIKYLTDVPMPIVHGDDGREIDDLNVCYELVYGYGGLLQISKTLPPLVDKICEYVDVLTEDALRRTDSVNVLCDKLMSLYNSVRLEIMDILENPEGRLDFLNNLDSDGVNAVLDLFAGDKKE